MWLVYRLRQKSSIIKFYSEWVKHEIRHSIDIHFQLKTRPNSQELHRKKLNRLLCKILLKLLNCLAFCHQNTDTCRWDNLACKVCHIGALVRFCCRQNRPEFLEKKKVKFFLNALNLGMDNCTIITSPIKIFFTVVTKLLFFHPKWSKESLNLNYLSAVCKSRSVAVSFSHFSIWGVKQCIFHWGRP